jgi:hypothetical protein
MTASVVTAAKTSRCSRGDRPAAHNAPMRFPLLTLLPLALGCASRPAAPPPDEIDALLAEVSPARIRADVDRLVSFGTRHTLSATEGPRGIGAARRWLKEEFERIGAASGRTGDDAVRVRFDVHRQFPAPRVPKEVDVVNVECVIPGTSPRRVYVVGHYDSRASEPNDAEADAPGANDDGSGTVALLEAARVLSTRRFDATIVLLATAGEEQGLLGAHFHAKDARKSKTPIVGVLSNDIVGDPSGPDGASSRDVIRLFSEGLPRGATPDDVKRVTSLAAESDSPSRQLARYVAEVAERRGTRVRPRLIFRPDRFLRGGDHLAFNEAGYAAVRFTDVFEKYDRQHQDVRVEAGRRYGDEPEFVDAEYLADVTRLNCAAAAHLANAPDQPADVRVLVAELVTDTTLRWTKSKDADVAGYEVVWRRTTSPTWDDVRDVGDVDAVTLPQSKDEFLFGVRAYDRDGFRCAVVFPAAAKE